MLGVNIPDAATGKVARGHLSRNPRSAEPFKARDKRRGLPKAAFFLIRTRSAQRKGADRGRLPAGAQSLKRAADFGEQGEFFGRIRLWQFGEDLLAQPGRVRQPSKRSTRRRMFEKERCRSHRFSRD
jgi:hypothetical protein